MSKDAPKSPSPRAPAYPIAPCPNVILSLSKDAPKSPSPRAPAHPIAPFPDVILSLSKDAPKPLAGMRHGRSCPGVKHYWVYLLRCSDGHYYVGVTSKLETRVAEHQAGIDPWCYTFGRRPVELVFNASFSTPEEAIAAEKRLKGWGRAKKEALVRDDWAAIRELSRSHMHAAMTPPAAISAAAHPSTSSG